MPSPHFCATIHVNYRTLKMLSTALWVTALALALLLFLFLFGLGPGFGPGAHPFLLSAAQNLRIRLLE